MNPVTAALLSDLDDPEAERFVRDWDELELMVIAVHKASEASFEQQSNYLNLQSRFRDSYPPVRRRLSSYWQASRQAGKVVSNDPYESLIRRGSAAEFAGNWEAMQTLPIAREALNQMLLGEINRNKGGIQDEGE